MAGVARCSSGSIRAVKRNCETYMAPKEYWKKRGGVTERERRSGHVRERRHIYVYKHTHQYIRD